MTTTYYAKFGVTNVSTFEVPEGKQFDGWTIGTDNVKTGSDAYKNGYSVGGKAYINISGNMSTIKVKVTVQNHIDGIVKTVGIYDVDYGTTVSTLVSTYKKEDEKGALQENNMCYAIGTYGNATLGSSWSGYKFTADTTVQQVCYIWIIKNNDNSQYAEGWVYCGDGITDEEHFHRAEGTLAIFGNDGKLIPLTYSLQSGDLSGKEFSSETKLTKNVNLIAE